MTSTEIISLIVTVIGVGSFATIFTILYKSYATSQIAELRSGKKDIELIDEVIYEQQTKIKRRRKVMKTIRTIVFYTIMVILVPLFIFSLVNRIQKKVTMMGNKTMMVVASGSMSVKNEANTYLVTNHLNNQFDTYDIIFLEKVDNPEDLHLYDIVAYRNDKDVPIIHRIKEIRTDGSYITRGDSNNEDDVYHPTFDDVIGRYTGSKLKGIGIFVMFLQSYAGIITVVSLVYCLIMIDRMTEKINLVQNKRIKQLEAVMDYNGESNIDNLKAEFVEKIYYKGFIYIFNENGFIEKKEINDGEYLQKSNCAMIKEVINSITSEKVAEEIVLDEKEGE